MLKLRRISRLLLVFTLISLLLAAPALSLVARAAAGPPPFRDTTKHWAAAEINRWRSLGLVGGYSDGSFRPEQATSRAEFLAFANRAFGFTAEAEVPFTDVAVGHRWRWDVAKAVAAGYAVAYPDGSFRPDEQLTRLAAGEMLYAILALQPVAEDHLATFSDTKSLTGELRTKLNAVVAGRYLGGFPDGSLRPQGTITRAQMIVILARAAGNIYNQAEVFGPAQGSMTVPGNVTVSKAGVSLRNLTIEGDLRLAQSIADGEVYLQHVTVKGRTFVSAGGGECVIASDNTSLGEVLVADINHNVRLTFDQTSSTLRLTWHSGGSYQSENTEAAPPEMLVSGQAAGQALRLAGRIGGLRLQAGVQLFLDSTCDLQQLEITETAAGTEVTIGGNLENLLSSAAGVNIARGAGGRLGLITLTAGNTVLVDGVAQTESGPPAAAPVTGGGAGSGTGSGSQPGTGTGGGSGTGSGPGSGTTQPGGGPGGKQPVTASDTYVHMTTGSVPGTISDGVNGSVDLRSLPDSAEIISMTFVAPAGATLDLSELQAPDLGRVELSNHLASLTVSVDDLLGSLSSGSVSLGALRSLFGNSVTVRGVASHPDCLATNVTLTVLLK